MWAIIEVKLYHGYGDDIAMVSDVNCIKSFATHTAASDYIEHINDEYDAEQENYRNYIDNYVKSFPLPSGPFTIDRHDLKGMLEWGKLKPADYFPPPQSKTAIATANWHILEIPS